VGERGSCALVSLDHITIETEVEMPTTELDHPIESIAPAGTQPLRPAASVAGTAPTATTAAAATTATIAVAPAAAPGAPGVYERLADSGELRIASAGSSADSSNARVQRPGGTRQIARDRLRGQGPAAVASAVSDGAELSAHAQAQLLESRGVDASLDLSIPGLEPRRASRWPWWVGSGTFAAALAFAALLAWRTPLSASPMLGPPLTHMYAALGLASTAQWNLSAYEVRQQGAEVDANDPQLIHVRFSLANHAARAQPTPLLRLTLLDRYGKRVAQRLLSPADYWPKGAAPMASLGSDQRIDTEVSVRDPNAASASFELDVCLRPTPGALRCAGDAD
jgi:hypothetical protein